MRTFISALLAGASLVAMGSVAKAAPAAPELAVADNSATLGEIVVTARRRSESLQEVPQTVNAVTSDTLQKLNITQFADIQTLVPGLTLSRDAVNSASLRGVTFAANTGQVESTVAFYMNDAPVQAYFLLNALFDAGQIEVLRGPQGTTRGVSAPSGAITLTTHKPDLSEYGGYVDTTLTDLQGRNLQAALNVPVIKDVLAVRFAALVDQTDGAGVRSIHNSLRPRVLTTAERFSVSFEPSDIFNANVSYQHVDLHTTAFDQVSGPGEGTAIDPAISPSQRVAVEDGIGDNRTHNDVVTAKIDSRIFGQHLSYVGSYQKQKINSQNLGTQGDAGDIVPGVEFFQNQAVNSEWTTHEIRLASDPAPGRLFDYTVGAFYQWQENGGHVASIASLLPGAFGAAPGVNLAAFNPTYGVPLGIDIPSTLQETSVFGSVTLHLGDKTELTGGIRHMWSIVSNATLISLGNGMLNLGALGLPATLPCSIVKGTAGANPGDCVLNTAGSAGNFTSRTSETPNIYNVSLSHHFTRDIMAYATTGTAYRPPVASVGVTGAIVGNPDPELSTLSFHPAEHSRSYELGIKTTFLGGRARLNADVFRQKFSNFTLYVPNINYISATGVSTFNFTASVDALVQGFDIDTAFQITRDWNVGLQASYADGKVQGSNVPCNTSDASGAVTFNHSLISLCPGGAASRLPLWNATLTSEYDHPITDNLQGFVRGLLTYYPQNKNRVEPNFTVPNYSLLNLYAGVRSADGAWEVSLFARNALHTQKTLDVSPVAFNVNTILGSTFGSFFPRTSGYFATTETARREVGVSLHYAWGSR